MKNKWCQYVADCRLWRHQVAFIETLFFAGSNICIDVKIKESYARIEDVVRRYVHYVKNT